jgi:hypothetical protein
MKKQIMLLIMTLLIPSVVYAHHGREEVIIWGIMFFLSLIISLILLKRISRHITINNKFAKFVVLFMIEIVLLYLLTIILFTLGLLVLCLVL